MVQRDAGPLERTQRHAPLSPDLFSSKLAEGYWTDGGVIWGNKVQGEGGGRGSRVVTKGTALWWRGSNESRHFGGVGNRREREGSGVRRALGRGARAWGRRFPDIHAMCNTMAPEV